MWDFNVVLKYTFIFLLQLQFSIEIKFEIHGVYCINGDEYTNT